MDTELQQKIDEIIANMREGREFDSHNLISMIMSEYPRIYIASLVRTAMAFNRDPFKRLHQEIGRYLRKKRNLIFLNRERSLNLRLKSTANAVWKKTVRN